MAGPSIASPTALPAMPNPKPIEVMNGAGCSIAWAPGDASGGASARNVRIAAVRKASGRPLRAAVILIPDAEESREEEGVRPCMS